MKKILFVGLILSFLFSAGCVGEAQTGNAVDIQNYDGNAPEFPKHMEWLNTDNPLSLHELRGKIVLLDFWTYCCINCMHIIPDLKKLEHKYADELVVIGVHSAKFLTEQGTDNIRQAILRYDLEHPVVNDKEFKIWKSYGANAWPTLVLIDPKGDIVLKRSGENIYDALDQKIGQLTKQYADIIDTTRMQFALEKDKTPDTFLRFPGKVFADGQNNRLYITDSNNNRIIITDLDGNLEEIIGSGKAGQRDGSFENAQFFHPQGLALIGDNLYIADTENHLIRKVDLSEHKVTTIAGVGKQVYQRHPSGSAKNSGLNSPWDLTIVDNVLYIAMAGSHQLWQIHLNNNQISLFAGSGYENIQDGPAEQAQLAQPSGLTSHGNSIYFADSEVSAVRKASISANGKVSTIIGHGLFEFGDVDGNYRKARFQHPLGIVYVDSMLYIADTYNNKIKQVDPEDRYSKTFAGTGKAGMQDGKWDKATFDEPGGISYADGKLYVADTNNQLIRVISIDSRMVSTLQIKGMGEKSAPSQFNRQEYAGKIRSVNSVALLSLDTLKFNLQLPEGFKINPLASSAVHIFTPDQSVNIRSKIDTTFFCEVMQEPVVADTLYAELLVYYCQKDNEGLCYIDNSLFEFGKNSAGVTGNYTVNYKITTD